MTIAVDLGKLVMLGITATAAHWIIGRSSIAKPFWSRLRGFPDKLVRCAGCSGVWLGAGLGAIGLRPTESTIGLDVAIAALAGAFTVPVLEPYLLRGLAESAIPDENLDRSSEAVVDETESENSDRSS